MLIFSHRKHKDNRKRQRGIRHQASGIRHQAKGRQKTKERGREGETRNEVTQFRDSGRGGEKKQATSNKTCKTLFPKRQFSLN
jgi:hypothetical protein